MAGSTGVRIIVKSNRLPAISAAIRPAVAAEVRKAGLDVQARAQALVPVLTGTLRRSITAQNPTDLSAVVGPSVEYGKYIEFGSRGRAARPYLRPAFEAVAPVLAAKIKATLAGMK